MHHFQVPVGRGYARAYDYCTVVMRSHENHRRDAQNALDSGTVIYVTGFAKTRHFAKTRKSRNAHF